MGDKKENSYSHILKYTGLFGSVQGLGILVGVLRNKFTALFLGPSGMGLLSLFSSTISVLSSACNFGIPTSGVKFISEKEDAADEKKDDAADKAETDGEKKHYNIIKRRIEKGQWFRQPCFGCSEFPVRRIDLIEDFDYDLINSTILESGDVDLGYMCYRVNFEDGGVPENNDWENPKFSDRATTMY